MWMVDGREGMSLMRMCMGTMARCLGGLVGMFSSYSSFCSTYRGVLLSGGLRLMGDRFFSGSK